VEFAGRTGGLDMNVDLDNVRCYFFGDCIAAAR
jgi:hypothetical protein